MSLFGCLVVLNHEVVGSNLEMLVLLDRNRIAMFLAKVVPSGLVTSLNYLCRCDIGVGLNSK